MKSVRSKIVRKDIGYAAIFSDYDTIQIKKEMELVQLGIRNPFTFFNRFDRYYDDQTVYLGKGKFFEPEQMTKKGNKLVNEGLTSLAQCQVGTSSTIFNVYAIGSGEESVSIRNDVLSNEISRLKILDNGGTLLSRGSTVFYSLFFPKTIATVNVSETAILNSLIPDQDLMLLRTKFPTGDYIQHTININDIFVGHVIYSGSA